MKSLWELPVGRGSITEEPDWDFSVESGYGIRLKYEDDDGRVHNVLLEFTDVLAIKTTYWPATTVEMGDQAYERVVDLGNTPWLQQIKEQVRSERAEEHLRHFMVFFDDDACFEVIGVRFEAHDT